MYLPGAIYDREQERTASLQNQLKHAREKLKLQDEKHEIELKKQAVELHIQEMTQDAARRKEFIRRINHDLKAPVTVMSWILAKLTRIEIKPDTAAEKIDKLAKTSNRLIDLLHELARSYETETLKDHKNRNCRR